MRNTARCLTWNSSWDAELSLFSFCSRLLIRLPLPSGVSGSFTTVFSGRLSLGNGDGLNQRRMPSKYLFGTKTARFRFRRTGSPNNAFYNRKPRAFGDKARLGNSCGFCLLLKSSFVASRQPEMRPPRLLVGGRQTLRRRQAQHAGHCLSAGSSICRGGEFVSLYLKLRLV